MHKNHLAGCAIGVVLTLTVVVFTGGSAGGLGVLAGALWCPIAMIVAMKFLMGPSHGGHDHTVTSTPTEHAADPGRR